MSNMNNTMSFINPKLIKLRGLQPFSKYPKAKQIGSMRLAIQDAISVMVDNQFIATKDEITARVHERLEDDNQYHRLTSVNQHYLCGYLNSYFNEFICQPKHFRYYSLVMVDHPQTNNLGELTTPSTLEWVLTNSDRHNQLGHRYVYFNKVLSGLFWGRHRVFQLITHPDYIMTESPYVLSNKYKEIHNFIMELRNDGKLQNDNDLGEMTRHIREQHTTTVWFPECWGNNIDH